VSNKLKRNRTHNPLLNPCFLALIAEIVPFAIPKIDRLSSLYKVKMMILKFLLLIYYYHFYDNVHGGTKTYFIRKEIDRDGSKWYMYNMDEHDEDVSPIDSDLLPFLVENWVSFFVQFSFLKVFYMFNNFFCYLF